MKTKSLTVSTSGTSLYDLGVRTPGHQQKISAGLILQAGPTNSEKVYFGDEFSQTLWVDTDGAAYIGARINIEDFFIKGTSGDSVSVMTF